MWLVALPPIWFLSAITLRHVWPSGCGRLWSIPWFACMHNGHAPRRMKEWQLLLHNCSGVVTMCRSMFNLYSALADGMERRVPVCASVVCLWKYLWVVSWQPTRPISR